MTARPFTFSGSSLLPATGERYIPGTQGWIQLEHFHRYLFALRFAYGRDVLDIASGEGYGSALLGNVAKSVVGVDIDPATVEYSNRQYASSSVVFRLGSVSSIPCGSSSVDLVVSFETIEHSEDHRGFLSEVRRVLRDDGVLLISTPDKVTYDATLSTTNEFHKKELTRDEFESLLKKFFPSVHLYEQRSLYGSVMMRDQSAHKGASTEFFESRNGLTFEHAEGSIRAPFLVAVASDRDVTPIEISLMHSPAEIEKLRGDLGYAVGEMWRLQARMPELEAESLALKRQVQSLEADLRDANTRAKLAHAEVQFLRDKLVGSNSR